MDEFIEKKKSVNKRLKEMKKKNLFNSYIQQQQNQFQDGWILTPNWYKAMNRQNAIICCYCHCCFWWQKLLSIELAGFYYLLLAQSNRNQNVKRFFFFGFTNDDNDFYFSNLLLLLMLQIKSWPIDFLFCFFLSFHPTIWWWSNLIISEIKKKKNFVDKMYESQTKMLLLYNTR